MTYDMAIHSHQHLQPTVTMKVTVAGGGSLQTSQLVKCSYVVQKGKNSHSVQTPQFEEL
uniref:Uncharacterized protein n=1 Tax=Arundo donax TaxID=35708 RepID=A0A0A9CBF3_ARUDO